MHVLYMKNINLDSADEGQNWDTVVLLVTIVEIILTGLKKKYNFHISH